MADLDRLIHEFMSLTVPERQAFLQALSAKGVDVQALVASAATLAPGELEKLRFGTGRFCPHCRSSHVVRNGKRSDGAQRFLCRDCHKTFQASTRTVLGANTTSKAGKLRQYVHCMCQELTVRASAAECGISIPTAFAWRHKILDTLAGTLRTAVLTGIIEYDETFFTLSFKGHPRMQSTLKNGIPLPPHKRGGQHVRGRLNRRKVCVPTALSRDGGFIGGVSNLGTPSGVDAINIAGGHCSKGAVLCTDGGRPGLRLAKSEGIASVAIKAGKGSKGIYSIQRVNAFHSGLKSNINHHFNGVATKYLNNYVVWHGFLHGLKAQRAELEERLYEVALTAICPTTTREVGKRDPVPILAKRQKPFMELLLLNLALAEYADRKEALLRLRKGIYSENDKSLRKVNRRKH